MRHLNFPYTFFSTLELEEETENSDPELYKAHFTRQETRDFGVPDEMDCDEFINRCQNGKFPAIVD